MIMDGSLETLQQQGGNDQLTTSLCFAYQNPSGTGSSSSMLGNLGCLGRGIMESTGDDSSLNTPVMGTPGIDTTNFSFVNSEYDISADAPPITGMYIRL